MMGLMGYKVGHQVARVEREVTPYILRGCRKVAFPFACYGEEGFHRSPALAKGAEQCRLALPSRIGAARDLKAEGLPHDGFSLADGERLIRVDCAALTGHGSPSTGRPK